LAVTVDDANTGILAIFAAVAHLTKCARLLHTAPDFAVIATGNTQNGIVLYTFRFLATKTIRLPMFAIRVKKNTYVVLSISFIMPSMRKPNTNGRLASPEVE
jgi:hypothetical protein